MRRASYLPTLVLTATWSVMAGFAGDLRADDPPATGELTQPDVQAALVGRTWQLVEIASMDDRVYAPDDRTMYTLDLSADGSVRVRADCNQGTGSWTSASPGKLEFGMIAATLAACPPGSLHDRYMAQFPWVRSYVMKDGHLFLATMADGSIIEFEPQVRPVAATVLGEDVPAGDAGEVQEIVLTRLFDRYAEQQDIQASDAEIDAFVAKLRQGMRDSGLTDEDSLTPDEAAEVAGMRREMGRALIERWKLNKALYAQYGGRIIFQQFGPEPLDAYRRYLEERQAAGDFEIHDPSMADAFWRYFTDDAIHSFYEPGSDAEAQAFATPPWEGEP